MCGVGGSTGKFLGKVVVPLILKVTEGKPVVMFHSGNKGFEARRWSIGGRGDVVGLAANKEVTRLCRETGRCRIAGDFYRTPNGGSHVPLHTFLGCGRALS
jgi:hypothetical protein